VIALSENRQGVRWNTQGEEDFVDDRLRKQFDHEIIPDTHWALGNPKLDGNLRCISFSSAIFHWLRAITTY